MNVLAMVLVNCFAHSGAAWPYFEISVACVLWFRIRKGIFFLSLVNTWVNIVNFSYHSFTVPIVHHVICLYFTDGITEFITSLSNSLDKFSKVTK